MLDICIVRNSQIMEAARAPPVEQPACHLPVPKPVKCVATGNPRRPVVMRRLPRQSALLPSSFFHSPASIRRFLLLAGLICLLPISSVSALRSSGTLVRPLSSAFDSALLGGDDGIFGFAPNAPSELFLDIDVRVEPSTAGTASAPGNTQGSTSVTTPSPSSPSPTSPATVSAANNVEDSGTDESSTEDDGSSQGATLKPVACGGIAICDVSNEIVRSFSFTRKQRQLDIGRRTGGLTSARDELRRRTGRAACSPHSGVSSTSTAGEGDSRPPGLPPSLHISTSDNSGCTHFLVRSGAHSSYLLQFVDPTDPNKPNRTVKVVGKFANSSNASGAAPVSYETKLRLPARKNVSGGYRGGRIFQISFSSCWCAATMAVLPDAGANSTVRAAVSNSQNGPPEPLLPLRPFPSSAPTDSSASLRVRFISHLRNVDYRYPELGWEEVLFPIATIVVVSMEGAALLILVAAGPAVLRLRRLPLRRVAIFAVAALFLKVCSNSFTLAFFHHLAATGNSRNVLAVGRAPFMLAADLVTVAFFTLFCVGDGFIPPSWRRDGRSSPVQAAAAVFFQFTVLIGVKAVGPHLPWLTGIIYLFAGGAVAALWMAGSLRMLTFFKNYASTVFRSFVKPSSTPLLGGARVFVACVILVPLVFVSNAVFLVLADIQFGRPDLLWLGLEGLDALLLCLFAVIIFPRQRFIMYADFSLMNDSRLSAAAAWRLRQARETQAAVRGSMVDATQQSPGPNNEVSGWPTTGVNGVNGATGATGESVSPVAVTGATASVARTGNESDEGRLDGGLQVLRDSTTSVPETTSDGAERSERLRRGSASHRSRDTANGDRLRRVSSLRVRLQRSQILRRIEQLTSGAQPERPSGLVFRTGSSRRARADATGERVNDVESGALQSTTRADNTGPRNDYPAGPDQSDSGEATGQGAPLTTAGPRPSSGSEPFPMRFVPEPRAILWHLGHDLPEEWIDWEPGEVPLPVPTRAMWGGFIQVAQAVAGTSGRSAHGWKLLREPPVLLVGLPYGSIEDKTVVLAVAEPQIGPGTVVPRRRTKKDRAGDDSELKNGPSQAEADDRQDSMESSSVSAVPSGSVLRGRVQASLVAVAGSANGTRRGVAGVDEDRSVASSCDSGDGVVFEQL